MGLYCNLRNVISADRGWKAVWELKQENGKRKFLIDTVYLWGIADYVECDRDGSNERTILADRVVGLVPREESFSIVQNAANFVCFLPPKSKLNSEGTGPDSLDSEPDWCIVERDLIADGTDE